MQVITSFGRSCETFGNAVRCVGHDVLCKLLSRLTLNGHRTRHSASSATSRRRCRNVALRHCFWSIMTSNEKSDELVVCQPFQTGGVAGGRSHYTEATGVGGPWIVKMATLNASHSVSCFIPIRPHLAYVKKLKALFVTKNYQVVINTNIRVNEMGGRLEWNRG